MGRNVSLLPRAKEGRSEDVSGPTVDALCRQRQPQAAHALGFHVSYTKADSVAASAPCVTLFPQGGPAAVTANPAAGRTPSLPQRCADQASP